MTTKEGGYLMRKVNKNRKYLFSLLGIIIGLLLFSKVDGAVAWMQVSEKLSNNFFSPMVDIEILKEDTSGLENFKIQNKSNTTVFVRAEAIGTLKNSDGAIVSSMNAGSGHATEGYVISMNTGTDWVRGSDGYFYYVRPVKIDEVTELLFKSYSVSDSTLAFELNVYAQAVLPENVEGAWGASLDESLSTLTPP